MTYFPIVSLGLNVNTQQSNCLEISQKHVHAHAHTLGHTEGQKTKVIRQTVTSLLLPLNVTVHMLDLLTHNKLWLILI